MSHFTQTSSATPPPACGRRAARFLTFLFTTLAWVAGAAAPLAAQPPLPPLYFADCSSQPGSVIRFDPAAATETALYTRPGGRLSGFAFAPWDPSRLYFVNASDKKIFEVSLARGMNPEKVVFTHSTFVRDIAFDGAGRLYFSEATGAGADGKIWRLDGGAASLYVDVPRAKVGGFWAGDFAFAPDGSLLVSSGNIAGAGLYKLDTATGSATKLYQAPATESLTGFVTDTDGVLYLTNQAKRIYRLDLTQGNTATVVADRPAHQTICAVGLRFSPPPKVVPAGTWVMPFGIGDISVNRIKASGLVDYSAIKDAPFGANLAFRLDSSNAVPTTRVFYYRYRYRRHGTLAWTDFEAPVSIHYVQNRPGTTPIFPTVKLGPTLINGMNLYRFRPHNPAEIVPPPPTGTLEWPKVPFPGDLSGSFLDTVSLTPAPGLYNVRLEIYSNTAALTPPGPDYQMIVPSGVDAQGTLLTKPAVVVAGGYELTLFIDNRRAEAEIAAPSIGATAADGCGFLRYQPAAPGNVRLGWHAWQPGKFAVYSFNVIRGANNIGTLPQPSPAPALPLPIQDEVGSTLHHADGAGNFFELSPAPGLLGGCQEAAFAATLHVSAKATNGYRRLSEYDASDIRAFAIAPLK